MFYQRLGKLLTALFGSFMFAALIAIVVLDVAARITYKFWQMDSYTAWPNRSWVWWITQEFRREKGPPDIVLMGSSSMIAAVQGGDATFFKSPQRYATHRHPGYLTRLLSAKVQKPVSIFSFDIGGLTPADAYMLTTRLLTGQKKPRLLILGLSPLCFLDSVRPSPASSETFRYMEHLQSVPPQLSLFSRNTIAEKLDWAMKQSSFLYQHKAELLCQEKKLLNIAAQLFGAGEPDLIQVPGPVRLAATRGMPEDAGMDDLITEPYSPQERFIDYPMAFKKRYGVFQPKQFEQEKAFLRLLLVHSQEAQIPIVLVNTPIAEEADQLLPAGFYNQYIDYIENLGKCYHVPVLDLNDGRAFERRHYKDLAHLNGLGAMQFFYKLTNRLDVADLIWTQRDRYDCK